MSERLQSNEEKHGINKSRGFQKAFIKGGIPLLVKNSKSPRLKNRVIMAILNLDKTNDT